MPSLVVNERQMKEIQRGGGGGGGGGMGEGKNLYLRLWILTLIN